MRTTILIFLLLVPATGWAEYDASLYETHQGKPITSITFSGNNSTKEYVITREIEIAVGDTLDLATIEEGYINLENLGIFGSIEIIATEDGNGVALEYKFREMPAFIPYIAFRYTEENGFSVGPAISSVNLFGRGVLLSGRLLFGGTAQAIVKLRYPWITGDYHLSLDLDANHIVRDDKLNEFEEVSTELTPWLGRYIGETGRVRGMVGYFRMQADSVGITLSPDQGDEFFQMGGAIGIDTRDSWRTPHHGWQGEVEIAGFFGEGNFLTTILDVRRFQPITERQTLFIGALTSLRTGTVGEDVPVYLQYRMGGANSIRGYDIDVLGRTLFGKNQMIGTFEYQFNVLPLQAYNFMKWSAALGIQLALFSDTGIAWSDSGDFTWDRAETGFGLGVRLLVPGTEMTRFDVAFNPDGDVYFHFGNWFKWTAQRFRLR